MKKLLALLAILALSISGSASATWPTIAEGWHKIEDPATTYASIPPPAGCIPGSVPVFNASTDIDCDAYLNYTAATRTLAVTGGTVTASNLTATALATPGAITVTPVLTQIGSITTPVASVRAEGLLTAVAKANLIDGETFTLDDGVNTTVFEFDVTGDGVGGGNVAVDVSAAGVVTATDVATVCANVMSVTVGATFLFNIADNLDGTVYIQNAQFGTVGNTVSAETVADAGFILTNMTGGADGVSDGDTFTVDDGTDSVTFEFDYFGVITPGNTLISLSEGDTADNVRDKIVIAVNTEALDCTAIAGGAGVVSLSRNTPGATGGLISEAVVNAGFSVTTWTDPTHATTVTYQLVACLADGSCTQAGVDSTTAQATATLNTTNYLSLSWSAVPGAATYKVYRKVAPTSPATTGLVYAGTALTVDDTGLAGAGVAAPTSNGTGVVTGNTLVGRFGEGTAGVPSISFVGDTNTGFYSYASDYLGFAAGGVAKWAFSNEIAGSSLGTINWAAGALGSAHDLGLARSAAGVLKVTDGGAGAGKIQAGGLQFLTGSRPTCDAAARGMVWYVAGGAGAADTCEICRKDASDNYAWVTIF